MSNRSMRYALAGWLLASAPASAWAEPATPRQVAANHLAIHVRNLEASARFYTDVLGLERMSVRLSPTMIWLNAGEFELHLIEGRAQPVQAPLEVHLAFRVPDLSAAIARLDAERVVWGNFAGQAKTRQIRGDGVLQIYFRDPDGYWIEVNQLPR